MRFATSWLVATAAVLIAAVPASAAQRGPMSPAELAAAIEHRADSASFADLRRFGDAAARGSGREALRRLNYVATVFRNQSEFDLFNRYNDALAARAAALHDDRYVAVAALNRLAGRYDQGAADVTSAIEIQAKSAPDWFVRVYAQTLMAKALIDRQETGAALKSLSGAELLIPIGDADARDAESAIWEMIGIALEGLDDLEGASRAFQRSQIEFANPAYPRPDFDTVYNLAHLAVNVGDRPAAAKMMAAHHRLTLRSDLPHLAAWDANLCGLYAEQFGTPQEVLRCLEPFGPDLKGASFLAPRLLPMRAEAEARIGDLMAARADLQRFETLSAKGAYQDRMFARLPEVRAEILRAQGRSAEAFGLLRDYARQERVRRAQEVYGGVRQITGALETQLDTARHDAALEAKAVRSERLIVALVMALAAGVLALMIVMARGARRLRAARQRAEAANAAKSTFLATISHEIRTPMNGVLGMAQAMQESELTASQRERLKVIRQSGEALLAILNDVLDLSKIEAGKLELELVEFDLCELLGAVQAAYASLAEQKGLAFGLELGPGTDGRYLGDPTRLRQIVSNLISNALKFTEQGEIRVLARRTQHGMLQVSVADTGIGIAPENLGKLFQKFDQLDSSTTRRFGGTGLGLAISRELAELMGGGIEVETEPGRGSCFTVTVPLTWCGGAAAGAQATLSQPAALAMPTGGFRVLAADDNQVNQLVLRALLEQVGIEPTVVSGGAEAVEAWMEGEWDLVLMDIQMPGMDGLTATARIRETEARQGRRRTPIVALTANAMDHQVSAYLAAGMDGHVSKPIQMAELLAMLDRMLPETDQQPTQSQPLAG